METWAWCLFFAVVFPSVVAVRTTFTISQSDPHLFRGEEHFAMKYAPHCFIGMFSSGLVTSSLLYALPVALQARPEFYFLE